MKLRLTYFKEGGKWYEGGTMEVPDATPHWEIGDRVLETSPSPGLASGVWEGPILVEPLDPDGSVGIPILLPGNEPIDRATWLRKREAGRAARDAIRADRPYPGEGRPSPNPPPGSSEAECPSCGWANNLDIRRRCRNCGAELVNSRVPGNG